MTRDILSPRFRGVLEEFASSNVLLAFDFDGTLAPIVDHPEDAAMRPETRRLLGELARLFPCIVISGRTQGDVRARLGDVPVRGVVGNHGAEPWQTSRSAPAEVRRWGPLLEERLGKLPGVRIENKTFSVTVHYRHAPEKKSALEEILAAARALGDVRVVGGAMVVNILPKGSPDKGIALVHELDRLRCESAIYVGDDDTDEDVFTLGPPTRLLTIRVGDAASSAAAYSVRSQAEVDDLLKALIGSRGTSSVAPPGEVEGRIDSN